MDDNSRAPLAMSEIASECVENTLPGKLEVENRGALRILKLRSPLDDGRIDQSLGKAMADAMPVIARDANVYAIVLRGGRPPIFSSGFDRTERELSAERRCELIWLLECFSKPVVSLVDGTIDGGGAGITLVNTHRVAGAGYAFSVAAALHGLCPDGGTAFTLSRLPSEIGTFLALTGWAIGRADAFKLGLVTHCIDELHYPGIENELADAATVDPLLDALHVDPGEGELSRHASAIATLFEGGSAKAIISRLQQLVSEAHDGAIADWAASVLADIDQVPPLARDVTLRLLRTARTLDLRQTLTLEHRLTRHLQAAAATANGQSYSRARVDEMFRPSTSTDLNLPTRQEMQAARI